MTLSLDKLDIADSRLISNGLVFWDNIPVNKQLVINIGTKTKNSDNHRHLWNTCYLIKDHILLTCFALTEVTFLVKFLKCPSFTKS